MMMSGQNVSDFDKQNVKLMSPRLLSLVPEGTDDDVVNTAETALACCSNVNVLLQVNLLSPSIFSLHNEGQGIEDELSLAKALKLIDEQGHEEWLNFVIEAAGVTDALSKMKVLLSFWFLFAFSCYESDCCKKDANAATEKRQLDEQFRDEKGQPLYFTKENVTEMYGPSERKKIDVFEELQRSLSKEQVNPLSKTV
ncbi:unnamed protein product [Strongylus vulgaris]|uniref:Uncharacterized protein n=1 Tax=Strongylus vulgaris TaxID=40348 RepID=A0A3P7JXP9_STRVU|nr:unnamed protein product [Strongylus vulgaris]